MTIAEVFDRLNTGGVVATLVIILSLVEITPIKLSPLQWIGSRVNKTTLDKVGEIEHKLDAHIAQSYRTKILSFQDEVLAGTPKTREQWKEIINAITQYEAYCTQNKISNGLCRQASNFLMDEYNRRLQSKNFAPDLI